MKLESIRLFVSAMELEMKLLIKAISPSAKLASDPTKTYLFAHDAQNKIGYVVTGIGPQLSEIGLENALLRFGKVQWVMGIGFAGGLVKTAEIGKTVLPTKIIFERSEENPTEWLRMSIASTLNETPLRKLVTRTGLVVSSLDKVALHAATGAEAVDMESAVWGKVCRSHGIPWVILRTVLDRWNDEMPESFPTISDMYGRPKWKSVIPWFISHPRDWKPAFRIQSSAKLAGTKYVSLAKNWLRTEGKK